MTASPQPTRLGRQLHVAAAVAAMGIVAACGAEPSAIPADARPTLAPVTSRIDEAELQELPQIARAIGSIEPRRRVSPGTKILGRIERFLVQEGDFLQQGQLLVELEKRDLEATLEVARSAVAMAEAEMENARAQRDRIEGLHRRAAATDKNLEDVVVALRVAEAALEQARAHVRVAQVTLEYAQVRAPIAGWVVEQLAEAGDMASPGRPLLTIEDISQVKVSLQVPEADVVDLAPGAAVDISIDVLKRTVPAQIDRIVPSGAADSRTFEVKILLENADGSLKPGMFARAEFRTGTRSALTVPMAAIVSRGQLHGVWVVDSSSRARLRWVRVGRPHGDRIEVLSGLDPGEKFLTDPPPGMIDGTKIVEE